ncbi:ATP-dependent helicase [Aureimonas sp. Leaf454]|uniref:ATP-dependent helicase HrpB n=1 Tax=Aureimonas sp. Leaf454 TaxID=1736381 RepID=UPI0006FBB11E|nr:ATP-dependent helicase HrpB [Aureimonas sp. Leaf454]KQT43049.1 ATP-dependent helicase [Aureimonas sp. Leaf454]
MTPPLLPDLPVTAILPDLAEALARTRNAVLVAPPGAGKTTLVPLHLLASPGFEKGRILLVEPRRLAARAAARRMAEILGERVGETVGWRMRLDTKVSARTRIEVVTEGVFKRQILGAPDLPGVCLVIFDEFHERSLDADLGLALALDVQGALREDLSILAMSATLDGAGVAGLLGPGTPILESAGRAFPVHVRHRDRPGTERIEDAVASAVREALAEETGSLLVFLPGQGEIARVAERLAPLAGPSLLVAPLFGAMDAAAQDLAIRPAPPGTRKIVLATSIAETSITIDGITVVVDSGLRRQPVFEPSTGLSRLETVRVSRAGADQRAGRAGRTAPGIAIRLWREEQGLEPFDRPEILSADLSGLLLDCASFGVGDPGTLPFLDPPPAPALAEARALLQALGAFDARGQVTATGTAMRDVGLAPRLARMVVEAGPARRLAADLAVLLTERGLGGSDPDLEDRLRRWRSDRSPRARDAATLARRIEGQGRQAPPAPGIDGDAEPGAILALAFPDRVASARGARGHFVLANGRGGALDASSGLASEAFIVVADLLGSARSAKIAAAARVSRESLEAIFAGRIVDEDSLAFDARSGEVRARRRRGLGRATFSEAPIPVPHGPEAAAVLGSGLREKGFSSLPLGADGERYLLRLRFLANAFGDPWPDLSDLRLLDTLEDWLMPFLPGVVRLSDIRPDVVREALAGLVPAEFARRIEALAPSHYEAPTGSRLPIRYEADGPVLAVRVQELYGLTTHPALAEGRLPLTLELLSPAHRPIQITRDLPGFWAGSWREVRADLRGRYPRHVWPEDPARAEATARAKPRG